MISSALLRVIARPFIVIAIVATGAPIRAEGLVESLVRRFGESDFVFARTDINAPFLPLAWLTATRYNEAEFLRPDGSGTSVTFAQSSITQGAFAPLPIGKRDAVVIGEWLSLTKFELKDVADRDFDVLSVAVPIGWARQLNPDWQLGAFVAPLGHRTTEDDWYWETLGGAFGRYTSSERTVWLFGAYFDVSPLEEFYTPYLGATFMLNEQWSIIAVMPWPSIGYAPNRDTYFRLGVAPSGTSWSVEPGQRQPRMNFSAWNLGLMAERRIYKSIWIGAELGVSGIRGLSLVGSEWQSLDVELDNTGFALLTINFRPTVNTPK